ncbi:MAG: glycosyltransferase family A protein [Gemmatimonadetes bacterium]|nr:glycosyltransferase family A protein [Gemmatimonadota bacterium]MDA1103331.1 glycosyltransferase family A protein [Gemmatimonadota bacterium]
MAVRPPAPAISVLMPVRDGAEHLAEAIASLEAQTFSDFEVLVVDDGSTDGTPELLRAWAGRDRRIHVVRQEPAGIVTALEQGRALARGRYLARMDADDIAVRHRFEAQFAFMEAHPDLGASGCLVRYFPRSALRDGARRYERWINSLVAPEVIAARVFVECPLAHPSLFMRAAAMEAVGGYVDREWPEDYDLVLRLWAAGFGLGKVDEVLLNWREGPDRLSRTDARYEPAAFLACKVFYLRETLARDSREVVIWGAGPVGKRLARALAAAGTRVAAFVELDPRKIGQEIHGAPVLETSGGLALRGPLHLAAVGQPGARSSLVAMFEGAGMVELRDFAAVA